MLEGILLALGAAFIYGFLGIAFELAGKRRYNIWNVILYKQAAGLVIGMAVWACGNVPFFSWRMAVLGLVGALGYVGASAAYLVAARERDIAANWTILNLSVVLPILVSVAWFHDTFTWGKGAGTVLTLFSILAIGGGLQTGGSRWGKAIAIAFFFNAWLTVIYRFVPAGSEGLFTVYFHGLSLPLVAGYKLARDRDWRPPAGLLAASLGAAVTHWGGMMLTMLALVRVARISPQAGIIVYPITNGLVIPLGVLMGVLLLKQKIGRRGAMGVAFGMAGLVCLFLP